MLESVLSVPSLVAIVVVSTAIVSYISSSGSARSLGARDMEVFQVY